MNLVKHLWHSSYELKYKNGSGGREGSLLKVEFKDGSEGHADLHPYPEKGEASLKTYLKNLKQKQWDFLSKRALEIAQVEATARSNGINLLGSLKIPESHYLILNIESFHNLDPYLAQGFTHFKVKLGQPLERQIKKLLSLIKQAPKFVRWRLDFHYNMEERKWYKWSKEYLNLIPPESLDFVEAPFSYKESLWINNNKLALDVWGEENSLPVPVLVCKTSRRDLIQFFKNRAWFKRLIFTHSLSHPLDQVASAYFAAQFYKVEPRLREVCALVQTDVYEAHHFTLPKRGPFFPHLSGEGWGFNTLSSLSWKKLF